MISKVNIAVIGAGWWCTEFHLPYLSSLENVNLLSVCRFGQKELNLVKNKFNFTYASENFEEALSYEELNGAIISTPHTSHYVCAKEALKNKLHVRAFLIFGFLSRFSPRYLRVRLPPKLNPIK